jgi:hypothetical protein
MPRLKNIDVNYSQIKDLVFQLAFEKKMALIGEIVKDKDYLGNFYQYSESLTKKHGIPQMNEPELDNFLHD